MKISQEHAISAGTVFEARYEILAELGTGGFGTVYKARQLATGQPVAIKVLRTLDDRGGPAFERRLARFQREMKLCGQMQHPNIVRLFDSGKTAGGLVYSVFEFAPGKDLSDVLARERRLDPVEAKHLMLQVLDALACAHAEGVVHRDLKPANIMVIPTGARRNALVLDFGIGAFIEKAQGEDHTRLTGTHESLGTPAYAAPEQLRGQPPTPRSDLYAWGLVFLECLTGKRVITGDSVGSLIFKQMDPAPIPMPAVLVDHALARILKRAVAKDPREREVTAQGLLRELEACDVAALRQSIGLGEDLPHAGSNVVTETVQVGAAPHHGSASPPGADMPASARPLEGERRQLTAVCCGLTAASTAAATDLEEIDELLAALQERGAEIARRFEGRIAGALGDQVLFYFGYPAAREDDARRAARAALELIRELGEESDKLVAERKIRVEIRIGVHTGLVVARELRETTPGGLGPMIGTTAKLAARLCALASPGTVMTSGETARLVRQYFTVEDEGPLPLDASARTLEVFRLREEQRGIGSGGASKLHDETPMIGRAAELESLLQRWSRAKAGEGQAVLVTGEAGIGKSRLTQELARKIHGEAHIWLECRCSPDSLNSALQPVIELLDRILDPGRDVPPERRADKLGALLTSYGFELSEAMPLFAPLLAIPLGDRFPSLQVSPQKQKELTHSALLSLLSEMAAQRPLVLAVEDLHWADPTTLELLNLLVGELASARICAVLSARPEFTPTWSTSAVLHLRLSRLGRPQIEEMATEVTQGKALPPELLEQVANRTDGVPLFVEELIRMMVESGALKIEGERYVLVGSLSELAIPSTLRDSLMARLDRLGSARETAQIAAALGREFTLEVLLAVSPSGDAAVREDLDKLVAAELVFRKRRLKQSVYTFKHALIRDTAYESMLKRPRQQVHARIAQALEDRFPETVAERPDLLALHHAAADQKREALDYALRAAAAALQRSANAEAIGHAQEAMGWLGALEDRRARDEMELSLNGILTPALMTLRGWANDEVGVRVERSRELIDTLGDSAHLAPTLWSLAIYHHFRGHRNEARSLARRLLALGERSSETDMVAVALPLLGQCLWIDGSFEEARQHFTRLISLYDPEKHRKYAFVYGLDPRMWAEVGLAEVLWFMGFPDQALARAKAVIEWTRELDHVSSTGIASNFLSMMYQHRGEPEKTMEAADWVLKMAERFGLEGHVGYARMLRSWATGAPEGLKQAITYIEGAGFDMGMSYYRCLAAELEIGRGEYDAALAALAHALERTRDGECYCLSEMLRLKGIALLSQSSDAGEACLRESIDVARAQGVKMLELRATTALCRSLQHRGSVAEARAALAAIYGWFTEGFETASLVEAKTLLTELGG